MNEPRLLRVALDCELEPADALGLLRGEPSPFALTGAWAGGGAVLGSRPLRVVEGANACLQALEAQPLDGGDDDGFGGGWVGHLGFPMSRAIERLAPQPPRPHAGVAARLAFYDHVLRRDADGRWWFEAITSAPRDDALAGRLDQLRARLAAPGRARAFRLGRLEPREPGWAGHRAAVTECIERIAAGELFQANLCMRFEGDFEGDPLDAFAAGVRELAPAYAAFVGLGDSALVSFSPELFLRRRGRHVVTAPIKGTAARDADPAACERQRTALLASAKDAAEHVMIVDLMRNDLGRVCSYGTVTAAPQPEAEAHPGVWHLVSEVSGELHHGLGDGRLLRACFPPGSVTGAPKVQALKVIAELEATGREAYTGAIGYASPHAGLELSVAIRTFEVGGGGVWLGAGGGIVADSDPSSEIDEAWRKAAPLAAALGGELAPPPAEAGPAPRPRGTAQGPRPDPAAGLIETIAVAGGRARRLDAHLRRLGRSAAELYARELPHGLREHVEALAATETTAIRVVAKLAISGIAVELQARPPAAAGAVRLIPARLAGGLGAHKWADRALVDALGADGATPLLIDLDDAVLEAGWANVFALRGGELLTPPADGRLLPGVTRAMLLKLGPAAGLVIREQPLRFEQLLDADAVLLSSSLRLLSPAALGASAPDPRAVELAARLGAMLAVPAAAAMR